MNSLLPPDPATTPSKRELGPSAAPAPVLTIPSWVASIALHATLVLLLISWSGSPAVRGDMAGDGGDSFRTVGIKIKDSSNDGGSNDPDSQEPAVLAAERVTPENMAPEAVPLRSFPETPQLPSSISPLQPQSSAPSLIGMGTTGRDVPTTPLVQGLPGSIGSIGSPSGGFGSGSGGGSGDGMGGGGGTGTSFMGVGAVGKRFVYIIDQSSSMATNQALQAAKLELLASIQRLDAKQQFQIIFYNTSFHVLHTRGDRFDVFHGTDANRLRVAEQIRDITPTSGTRHLPAILEGLKFNPDVIFLLTDGASESALDQKDMQTIFRHNRGGTHIHCIEFGTGSKSPLADAANFLIQLANDNQGRYLYRNTHEVLQERMTPR